MGSFFCFFGVEVVQVGDTGGGGAYQEWLQNGCETVDMEKVRWTVERKQRLIYDELVFGCWVYLELLRESDGFWF